MKYFLIEFTVFSSLLISPALSAQDHHDDQGQSQRYYDSKHKDYHTWNSDEDQKFHQYLKDNHKSDHEWAHASKREQQSYFNYSHQHGDSHDSHR